MSNHVHVVPRIDLETAATWTPEEVATRWVRLFPATINGEVDTLACRTKEKNLFGNAERLEICRERLRSLAWSCAASTNRSPDAFESIRENAAVFDAHLQWKRHVIAYARDLRVIEKHGNCQNRVIAQSAVPPELHRKRMDIAKLQHRAAKRITQEQSRKRVWRDKAASIQRSNECVRGAAAII